MDTLFTLGYQGHSIGSFGDLLLAHGITRLIDIRERPYSRKPDFSKKRLAAHMEAVGIAYLHLVELGTPKPLRDEVRRSKNYPAFFATIRPLFAAQEQALDQALAMALAEPCALLCYEGPASECHRTVVAELLAERSDGRLQVVHL
ncbi:MAG TPA: DUF488 domain-containing protein [Chloroflexaceae bacterium]|nr:DUF488 domain-containing protein [Chloroflexaceae bacterium]